MNPLTHTYSAGRPGTRGDAARGVRVKREARADKRRGRVWNNVIDWACAEWPQVMEYGRRHDDARYRTDWPYTREASASAGLTVLENIVWCTSAGFGYSGPAAQSIGGRYAALVLARS